jgi:hypothetical protein
MKAQALYGLSLDKAEHREKNYDALEEFDTIGCCIGAK